jgi:hypothetical protein
MRQRIYQTMKFFALLVFSLEILAPAFIQGIAASKKENTTYITNANYNPQNQLGCLVAEELGINEEDGDHKEFVSLFSFDFISVFDLHLTESTASSRGFVQHSSTYASQRPLYLLHSILLI